MASMIGTTIGFLSAITVAYSVMNLLNKVDELESMTNKLEDEVFQLKNDLNSCECGD